MLDIRSYDLATLYRFKVFYDNCHWFNVPTLPITEIRNNKIYKGERIEFPLIALRRVATPIMYKDGQNSWATVITGDRRGRDISIAPDMTHSTADMTMVQSSYELRYMLDVFSFERDNFDELVVEIQENLFRYPYLTFENWKNKDLRMPDPQVSGMSTNITWESTEDNTDLEAFDTQTPFYRATITFTLRAYIYRKYAALLVEELLNGYRILDYNKVTQQVVDSDYHFVPNNDDIGIIEPDSELFQNNLKLSVKYKRDRLLNETSIYTSIDAPLSDQEKEELFSYRKKLWDILNNSSFEEIEWPEKPSWLVEK